MLTSDAICALATPPGAAGLAVVRLSGDGCLQIADACFRGRSVLQHVASHTAHYGKLYRADAAHGASVGANANVGAGANADAMQMLDTVVATVFRAPNSYTGEDVVEFGCHGGVIVSQEIVEALIRAGARPAEPGEFTKRAFLNSKLDLTQVEAVGDLIHAVSTQGSHAAARQLTGGFTARLAELREQVLRICGLLELELDFSQEDLELINRTEILQNIEAARKFCEELAASHRSAEILRSGYAVGIVGYPNAGKSSLLNALLQRKRAIVSDIPGTTRDYIEECITLGGLAVKLVDTAGFRSSQDVIEIEGINLAESLLEQCNMIVVLNDITLGERHSEPLLHRLRSAFPQAECVLVQNKIDAHVPESLPFPPSSQAPTLRISAVSGTGIEELKDYIRQQAQRDTALVGDALINARQAALLRQASASMQAAMDAVRANASNEFIALDLREALKRIGEITGAVWNEDILNSIFSKFCIGK